MRAVILYAVGLPCFVCDIVDGVRASSVCSDVFAHLLLSGHEPRGQVVTASPRARAGEGQALSYLHSSLVLSVPKIYESARLACLSC